MAHSKKELIELVALLKKQRNQAPSLDELATIVNQIKTIKRAIIALNAQDLSTTAGYLIQIAEYYAFLGLIMTAAQNSSIVPGALRTTLPTIMPHEDFGTSSSLSTKIDIVQMEDLLERLEEDLEDRLDMLDHPDKTNIRKILRLRKQALLAEYNQLCLTDGFIHPQKNLSEFRYMPVGIIFSLIGVAALGMLTCHNQEQGFGYPSQETVDKNIDYLLSLW
jgi:hypothetical protein